MQEPQVEPGIVSAIRDFNRLYTRQLGLLERGYLGTKLTLTEARVLYELANRPDVTAAEIARLLQLDVGYLSRILAKFRRLGWLGRKASAADGRRHHLRLSARGRAAFAPLDSGAREQIAKLVAPLPPAERRSLVTAMRQVGRAVLPAADKGDVVLRDLEVGDIGWVIHRQGILYAEEYGWDVTYEALVAKILGDFVAGFDAARDGAWIAELDGAIVGSVFLVRVSKTVAKLRLLYVEPRTRGLGLGRRLVRACIDGARRRGYRKLELWTNDVLTAARRIYQSEGFQLVRQERHRSFGKKLTGQFWELDLGR